jgi:hypothetical protein
MYILKLGVVSNSKLEFIMVSVRFQPLGSRVPPPTHSNLSLDGKREMVDCGRTHQATG